MLSAVFAVLLPLVWKQPKFIPKLFTLGAIVGIGVIPWMLLTGFFSGAAKIPNVLALFDHPLEFLAYPLRKSSLLIPAMIGTIWFSLALIFRNRWPKRFVEPFVAQRRNIIVVIVWILLSYALFHVLIPAASYFEERLTLMGTVSGLLLTSIVFASASRVISPRYSYILAPIAMVIFLAMTDRIGRTYLYTHPLKWRYRDAADAMLEWEMRPGTRVYSTPNDHLPLTYYTGIPVQSIAPVRKSFIDNYEGDLIVIQAVGPYSDLWPVNIRRTAAKYGQTLTGEDVARIQEKLRITLTRRLLDGGVAEAYPPLTPLSPMEEEIAAEQIVETQKNLETTRNRVPMFHEFHPRLWTDWWPTFFYRFVNVEQRSGDRLNYAELKREARAVVLPYSWVVYERTRDGYSAILPTVESATARVYPDSTTE